MTTLPLPGTWYASAFPGAGYASQLSNTEPFLGVFQATQAALLLKGVVSPTSGHLETELTYAPSATTSAVPDADGGRAGPAPPPSTAPPTASRPFYTEEYESIVDAPGTLKTPLRTFQVLRVQTT